MAEGTFNESEQLITLTATDTATRERMAVQSIILTGTAAGAFVLVVGNTAMTINTGSADLTKIIPINRSLNYIELTSGPAAATAYVLLEHKR